MCDVATGRDVAIFQEPLQCGFLRGVQSAIGARHDALLDAGGEITAEYLKLVRAFVEHRPVAGGVGGVGEGGRGGCEVSGCGGDRFGRLRGVEVFPVDVTPPVLGGVPACERGDTGIQKDGGVVEDDCVKIGGDGEEARSQAVRGKHYAANKAKRERAKRRREGAMSWRCGASGVGASTVMTVDSRTAEEIEAARTLAVRRTVENKVAAALAEHKLASLQDKSKTEMIRKWEAARYEQRINDAKAKSQASFKKCDESLKSLGSTGSAGEFALKQEVAKLKGEVDELEMARKQIAELLPYAPAEVHQRLADMPVPRKPSALEIFGDCPSEYDEEEAEAYYNDLLRLDMERGLC